MLFSESKTSGTSISAKTCALLSAEFGDVQMEHEPTSFKGYCVWRDRPGLLLRLTMPQKIIEAAREHLPDLLDGYKLSLPSGKKLMEMADALELVVPQPAKLDSKQVQIQRLIGSLKFIEQLHPRLSLILHRLSCLMSAPPHEALLVVQAPCRSLR